MGQRRRVYRRTVLGSPEVGRGQASAGATVKDQPESVSTINRNSVKDQVTPDRQASPGTRQSSVGRVGIEPTTRGLKAPCSATELTAPMRFYERPLPEGCHGR